MKTNKELTGKETIIIDREDDIENGTAIELFKNDSGKFGVRLIDTDVDENVSCKLWDNRIDARKYYDENKDLI